MKKSIILTDEVMARLQKGKCIEGSLRMDVRTGVITFRGYNRLPRVRRRDRLICYLEHGWLKESKERYKLFQSVPKQLGRIHAGSVMEREAGTAKDALTDLELDLIEFC